VIVDERLREIEFGQLEGLDGRDITIVRPFCVPLLIWSTIPFRKTRLLGQALDP
jgi:broad specificity phosphatase PhoE